MTRVAMNSASNGSQSARKSSGRPVIGICARRAPVVLQGLDLTVSLVIQPHVDLLAAAGCTPVVVPLVPGAEHLVERLDGLLVPGGPDVDPSLYGQGAHPMTRAVGPAMDTAELALLDGAYRAGLPVLAVCRGMQLLNVHRGGTLHQHLPEVTGDDGHCPSTGTHTFGRQRLEVRPGSRIAEVYDGDPPDAACHHHQAVDRLGTGLTATAWAPDGVVEAVEATDRPFVVGVQWEAGQIADERLHRALAEAARSTSPRTALAR
ncbi:gamma-glutamyl-gamma-aminobutyrate hydrolase family protein [Streptomyces uncialis]|uniref:gamma-glutamyl-gamma-aminobutyrate hydrolase family protein n=1 Tax=Streptomyces uncialis TaxID=1048205 RepID=UPI00379CD23E